MSPDMRNVAKRILIIDDHSAVRDLAVMALGSEQGWHAQACGSGEAALEEPKYWRPGLSCWTRACLEWTGSPRWHFG